MLYSKKNLVADRVVDLLTFQPGMGFADIQKALAVSGVTCSFQGLYKSLAVLRREGVIVAAGRKYSLNTVWVNQLVRSAYFMRSNYIAESSSHKLVLPNKQVQKLVFKFPDLLSMDVFWGHVAVALAARCPGQPFYFYNPHTWFFVAHQFESQAYFNVFAQRKVKNYTVVGARTAIDRWSERFHPKGISEYYCAPEPLFDSRLYLTAIGPYYIVVKIEAAMARRIDKLFFETMFDFRKASPPEGIGDVFAQKSPCRMVVYHDEKKAGQCAQRIAKYF